MLKSGYISEGIWENKMKRLVIGSPVKQKSNILKEFLISLEELKLEQFEVYYYFIDDNTEEASSILLSKFKENNSNVLLKNGTDFINEKNEEYVCTSDSHYWKKGLINRIIEFKNDIIRYAREINSDYLFFVDSDIVLYPDTINHLASRNVDILSNVFWTKWSANAPISPQVWKQDESNCYERDWDTEYTPLQKRQLELDFVNQLKIPGIYRVGGLGACTLLNKRSIESGVNFSLLDNISFWGEDRHFCIRARALGLELYVDTVYPAYHIYRESYLLKVNLYKERGFDFNMFDDIVLPSAPSKAQYNLKPFVTFVKESIIRFRRKLFRKKRKTNHPHHITLSMIVKNEEGRYLERMLQETKKVVDQVVIIDDASTDNTVKICEEILRDIPHKIVVNKTSMFHNEVKLREKQWKETLALNPDWILFLDADEVLEKQFADIRDGLVNNSDIDLYCFRLFDMWNEEEYRSDELWNAHERFMPFMLRYQPKFKYKFKNSAQHCGRMPSNVFRLDYANIDVKIKHFGWSREEDRKKKYERYMLLDPEGKDGSLQQYKSILDETPHLERFNDAN